MEDDPLAVLDQPPAATPDRCPPDCEGGWRQVSPLYADSVLTHDERLVRLRELDPDAAQEQERLRRAALLASVYPCEVCRPDLYRRWWDGHMAAGHSCDECNAVVRARKAKG